MCHGPLCIDRPPSRRWRRPGIALLEPLSLIKNQANKQTKTRSHYVQVAWNTKSAGYRVLMWIFACVKVTVGVTRSRCHISFRCVRTASAICVNDALLLCWLLSPSALDVVRIKNNNSINFRNKLFAHACDVSPLPPPTSPSGLRVFSVSFPVGDFVILSVLLQSLIIYGF